MPIDPSVPGSLTSDGRLAERVAELERQVRSMQQFMQGGATSQFPVVSVLPAFGRKGRVLMLASDSKLYADTGTAWVAQT